MPGGWGSKKNGVKIGAFWDGIEVSDDGSQARAIDAHINIDRDVNISDTSNRLEWSGGAITDGSDSNINVSGSGEERIKSCSETWVTLTYGSTTSRNFSASFSGINYAGGTLTVSKTVTYPARAVLVPNAPSSVAAGRVSETSQQIRVQWVNNPVTPDAPYTAVAVERSDEGGAWVNVSGDLPSTTTSWTDAQTVPNRRYEYRVLAKNASGTTYAAGPYPAVTTTPAVPVSVALTRVGSDITVTWSNAGTPWYSGTEIVADRGGALTTYTVGAGVESWADPAENPAVVQQYTLRHYISGVPLATGATFTDYSSGVPSASVQLENPPLAPTVSLSAAVLDATDTAQVISWVHNPVDASAQTEAEVRWRLLPAGSYTTVAKTTETDHTLAAGTLTNDVSYGVQVRTRGSHATFGPWSAEATFATSTRPVASITSPFDGAIIQASAITLTLGYVDTGGSPDAAGWQILLYELGDDAPVDPVWPIPADVNQILPGSVDDAAFVVPYAVQDDTYYEVRVRAMDAAGLWSAWSSSIYSVEFADPVPGVVTDAECDVVTGSVTIRYWVGEASEVGEGDSYGSGPYGSGPYGGGASSYIDAVSAEVQRFTDGVWVTVCSNDFSGVPVAPYMWECVDPIPPLGGVVQYRVVTYSDIPTVTEGAQFSADCMLPANECVYPDGMRIYLNAGPDWSVQAVIIGNPSVSEPVSREKVLVTPVGRVYPIELLGIAVEEKYSLSGVVARDPIVPVYLARLGALRSHWADMARMPAPICYRDPFGKRIFGSIDGVSTDWGTEPVSPVKATITRTSGGDV